jgi:hypothetical protein
MYTEQTDMAYGAQRDVSSHFLQGSVNLAYLFRAGSAAPSDPTRAVPIPLPCE